MMKTARLTALAATVRKTLSLWKRRAATRYALSHLSPHLRADIGLDDITCDREIRRRFWQGTPPEAARKAPDRSAQSGELPRFSARTAVRDPSS